MKPVLSVLVVESRPLAASKITSFLQGRGWDVDYAACGKMALKHGQCHHYDVVLVNTQLPDMTFQEVYDNFTLFADPKPSVLLMSDGNELQDFASLTFDNIIPDQNDIIDIVNRCQTVISQRKSIQPATLLSA